VSAAMILKEEMNFKTFRPFDVSLNLDYRFVIWRGISNLFLLSSRLIVVMVVANGFSFIAVMLIVLIFIIQFLIFVMYSIDFISDFYGKFNTSMAKMFVQFEDYDLTNIPLFVSNTLLHFTNVSISFGVTLLNFLNSSQSEEFIFYLSSFVWVEVGMLVSILIEYLKIKPLAHKALKAKIHELDTSDREIKEFATKLTKSEMNWKDESLFLFKFQYNLQISNEFFANK